MSTGNLHNAMRSLTAATLIALSAVTLSCTKTQIEPEIPKGPAIEFSTKDPWTKAPDEAALEAMRKGSFNVWGWFRGTTNGHVFDATEVYDATYNSETGSFSSTTPNWTYDPENPRYWMNGLYDFAAVYPFDTPNVTFNPQTDEEGNTLLDGKPVLIIQDFDSSTQKDLLVALNSGPDGNGINGGEPQGPVALNFKHVLTKVNVKIVQDFEKDPDNDYYITKVTLSNVKTIGTYLTYSYNNTTEHEWIVNYSETGTFIKEFNAPYQSLEELGQLSVWGDVNVSNGKGGLLLIPQSIEENSIRIRLDYRYLMDGSDLYKELYAEVYIPISEDLWKSNEIVTYNIVFAKQTDIKFETPTIEPWDSPQTGGTIVIK